MATVLTGTDDLRAPVVADVAAPRKPEPDTTERVNQLEVVLRYILYIIITVFLFVPFLMTVLSSFKTSAEVIAFPPTLLPSVWHPENYLNVLTQISGFPRMIFNSFFVTLLVLALNLFFDSLVGYAFARLEFPFKNVLFSIMIATMVIPGFVFIVPRYILLLNAHVVDTYFAFVVLYFVQPAFILLMT
jgi:multiple sugar transport system permease protein